MGLLTQTVLDVIMVICIKENVLINVLINTMLRMENAVLVFMIVRDVIHSLNALNACMTIKYYTEVHAYKIAHLHIIHLIKVVFHAQKGVQFVKMVYVLNV